MEIAPERLAISAITIPDQRFDDDVALLARHGVSGLGLWEYKIARDDVHRVAGVLDAAGIAVASAVPLGNSVFPSVLSPEPAAPSARVEALKRRIARLAPLAPQAVVLLTGPPEDEHVWAREYCRGAFAELARTARDEGVRLALEPVHPSAAPELCLFDGIADAADFVDAVDEPALGLLLDAWHVGHDPQLADDLRRHHLLVAGVHLADHRRGATHWPDRAFPGEGGGESERLVALLDENGYAGFLEVEIFSDDGRYGTPVADSLWRLPPDEIVARCLHVCRTMGVPRSDAA